MPGSPKRARPAAPPTPSRKSAAATRAILEKLFAQHPNATTELAFTTPFELLVATILSAQSSDKRVNEVTPALFARYPDAQRLVAATAPELEPQIVATGFFRQKSRALLGMAAILIEKHGGQVPADMDALTALPGVGRKTANVVLGHALGVPGLPVDRHVLRVANRIGIAQAATPEDVETQLCAAVPREQWTLASSTLILHGRRICRPTQPLCPECAVVDQCAFAAAMRAGSTTKAAVGAAPRGSRPARATGASRASGRRLSAPAGPSTPGGAAAPPHTQPLRRKPGVRR